ncbi:hypothetical protein BGZ65_010474 [Modicella reniformis]|uniref:Uncharacterized protein n=1 Tax=Modicella reniformis TaxID=1440133 RepID=A0A9P6M369_9FUNG|nr:hypothetical protein BGZ65_010474 [Modicella reniformis]
MNRVCIDRVGSDIKKAVGDIMSKKKMKAGETKESLLEAKRKELKSEMEARPRVPRGIVQKLHSVLTQNLYSSFSYVQLRGLLEDGENITCWRRAVQTSFDDSWAEAEAVQKVEDEEPTTKKDHTQDKNEDENVRTCTVTLKQILRPDLMEHYKNLTTIAEQRQTAITNSIDELAVLTQKTLLVMASGALYKDCSHSQELQKPEYFSFDIKTLLPPSFNFRAEINQFVEVASLPPQLQGYLESGMNKPRSQDDLAHFLSQDHLQFLHSQFLSSRQRHNNVEGPSEGEKGQEETETRSIAGGKHSIWTEAAEIVKRPLCTADIPTSPEGMSTTINEHIRLLSTAVGNLWSGSVYKKFLDYLRILLRILLRLNRHPCVMQRGHRSKGVYTQ